MKRLCLCILLLTALIVPVFAAPGSTSMPSFWRYAHPEAKALIGVEWNRILHSSIGAEIRQKLFDSGSEGAEALQLIDQVQRVFISSPGVPDGAPEGAKPSAVFAAQGNFDLAGIRAMVEKESGVSRNYRDVEILDHTDEKGEQTAVALVSPQLVLAGDVAAVEGAIDHHVGADPEQASNPLFQRASQLAAGNDIWLVANASPSDFGQAGGQQAQFLKDLERLEVGISMQSGLGIQLNLGAKSPQSATEMAAALQLVLGMMLSSQQQKEGMPNLAEKLQISTEQELVKLALHMDEGELQQTFGQMASSFTGSFSGGEMAVEGAGADAAETQTAAATQYPQWSRPVMRQTPEVRTGPRVIRIWGLDDGPREIKMNE